PVSLAVPRRLPFLEVLPRGGKEKRQSLLDDCEGLVEHVAEPDLARCLALSYLAEVRRGVLVTNVIHHRAVRPVREFQLPQHQVTLRWSHEVINDGDPVLLEHVQKGPHGSAPDQLVANHGLVLVQGPEPPERFLVDPKEKVAQTVARSLIPLAV